MAVDIFLKLDGVPGESADDKHKGEIDVMSWSWGVSQTGTFGGGGGGGAGKANFQDFHFTMKQSKASPKLFIICATGEHIKKAVLVARKAGKTQQEYFSATFFDLLVSSFQTGGSDIEPMESISMNFSKVELNYKEQKADGSLAPALEAKYDVKANKAY